MIFKTPMDYKNFSHTTQYKNRYIHDEKIMYFLEAVLATSEERQVVLDKGYIFWRAQLGNNEHVIVDEYGNEDNDLHPHPKERMKPLLHSATEGRGNPKGIPYLYLATDKETAMSEVRPWVGSTISVGQFKIKKELNLIECVDFKEFNDNKLSIIKTNNLSKEDKRKLSVWSDIDKAFSEPVNSTDKKSEYVPTQILAEFFKSKGFDGIAYKSSLSNGVNIILFDSNMADLINCLVYEVQSVQFEFKEVGPRYII